MWEQQPDSQIGYVLGGNIADRQLVAGHQGSGKALGADGKESKEGLCSPESLSRYTSTYTFRG